MTAKQLLRSEVKKNLDRDPFSSTNRAGHPAVNLEELSMSERLKKESKNNKPRQNSG